VGGLSYVLDVDVVVDGEGVPAVRLGMDIGLAGYVDLNPNNRLTGKVAEFEVAFSLQWAIVPVFNVSALNPWLQAIVDDVLLPVLNSELASGIPLPLPAGVSLFDPIVSYTDGHVSVLAAVRIDTTRLVRYHHQLRD